MAAARKCCTPCSLVHRIILAARAHPHRYRPRRQSVDARPSHGCGGTGRVLLVVLCKLASRNASRGATPALTVWLAAFAFRSMGDFTFTIRATMGNPEINFTAGPPQLRPAYGGGKQWRKVTCPGAPGCVHEEPCAEGFWIEDAKKDDPSYRSRQYNTHKNAKHGEVRTGALFASNTTMSPHRFMSPPRSLGSDPDESSRERPQEAEPG